MQFKLTATCSGAIQARGIAIIEKFHEISAKTEAHLGER